MLNKIVRRIRLVSTDRRWWGFYLQRRFLNPRVRQRLASYVAAKRRVPIQHRITNETTRGQCQELKDKGITLLGQILSPDQSQKLFEYFRGKKVFDPYRQGSESFFPFDDSRRHPDAHIAHHTPEDLLRAPYLLDLVNSEAILQIVSNFLGCKPTIGYLAAWWSYPTQSGAQQAEFFHRDVDDWKFVKLFVYLTDVNEKSGPHIYVKNSSSDIRLTEIRRFNDEEVRSTFGPENILVMTAKAGQGFLEDTYGIHKGQPVLEGKRLIFQAVYGLSPLPYGPKVPVLKIGELEQSSFDPWINRVYIK